MAGTESKEREALKKAYSSVSWQEKVKKMSDQQVQAVYLRLKRANKI